MSNFIPQAEDEPEIEAVLPPIFSIEEKPAIIKEIKPIDKYDSNPNEAIPILQKKIQPIIHKTIQPVIRKEIKPIITRQVQKVIRKEIQPIIPKEIQSEIARKIHTDVNENIQPVTINHPTFINSTKHYSEVSKLKYDLNEAKIIIQQQKDIIAKLQNKLNIIESLKYEIRSKDKELIELKSKINQIILKEVEQRLRNIKRINYIFEEVDSIELQSLEKPINKIDYGDTFELLRNEKPENIIEKLDQIIIEPLKSNNETNEKFIRQQMMCVYFTSMDQNINFSIPCINLESFQSISFSIKII